MTAEPSIWSFIINAGFVVKIVMLILLLASVSSWMIIIQRILLLRQTKQAMKDFEQRFWSGIALNQLYTEVDNKQDDLTSLEHIFAQGMNEYKRLSEQPNTKPAAILEGVQRAMRIAQTQEMEQLEDNLSFLATVGSTSPYIGLFGTVWGIMTSFRALGTAQQATIAMVAPGIAEALIATAIGLFAAIPAVIAFNRFNNQLERMDIQFETFQEELTNILHRQAHGEYRIESQVQQPTTTATPQGI